MKNKNGDKNNIIDNEIGEDIIKNKIQKKQEKLNQFIQQVGNSTMWKILNITFSLSSKYQIPEPFLKEIIYNINIINHY